MTALFLLGFLAVFLFFGLKRPFLWVCAYLYVDILAPQKIGFGVITSVPVSLIAFAAAFGGWLMIDKKTRPTFTLRQALMLFLLGFFLEWIEICYIVLPLFWPILDKSGVDPVWFAILAGVNLQTSFLTPPVGWALFFLKGVAPPEVSSKDIYVGVMPFVALQLVGLVLLFLYPSIATWLPKAIGW